MTKELLTYLIEICDNERSIHIIHSFYIPILNSVLGQYSRHVAKPIMTWNIFSTITGVCTHDIAKADNVSSEPKTNEDCCWWGYSFSMPQPVTVKQNKWNEPFSYFSWKVSQMLTYIIKQELFTYSCVLQSSFTLRIGQNIACLFLNTSSKLRERT